MAALMQIRCPMRDEVLPAMLPIASENTRRGHQSNGFHIRPMELAMQRQWVVVADSSRARFFEAQGNLELLVELEDLLSPAGRMNDADLTHDAKGRFYGKGGQVHTAEPAMSAKIKASEQFSNAVTQHLEKACETKRYDRLILVAPPKFLGQLHRQLSHRVIQRITQELPLDISSLSAAQISDHVRRHRR